MANNINSRLLAMKALIVGLTLVVGFSLAEVVLRTFPSLIGLGILTRMEPSMRSEIAGRLGLPTLEAAIRITPDMRTDGGPTIVLPGANSLTHMYADKADLDQGAIEMVQVDENGLCNAPGKAATKSDILVAGDSFTFCTAVTANDTATHKLEELSGRSAYNLGIRGTGPHEYLEMLKRYAPQFSPRIAVMNIYEGNDLRDVLIYDRFKKSGGRSEKDRETPEPAWSYAAQVFKAGVGLAGKIRRTGDRRGRLQFPLCRTGRRQPDGHECQQPGPGRSRARHGAARRQDQGGCFHRAAQLLCRMGEIAGNCAGRNLYSFDVYGL